MEVHVESADLSRLASQLRGADVKVRRSIVDGLQRAAQPTRAKVRASARSTLPSRGGLASLIASSRVSARTSLMAARPTVRIEADLPGHGLGFIDEGRLRHPTFGRRGWVSQSVRPGFFSDPIEKDGPRMSREVHRTVQRVIESTLRV